VARYSRLLSLLAVLAVASSGASVPASAADQPVQITIVSEASFWPTAIVDWIDQVFIPNFNRDNPHIQIQPVIRTSSWSDRKDKITAMLAAGLSPDIVVVGHTHANAEGIARGWLLPLDDYLAQWEDLENFVPTAWSHFRPGGVTLAIPQGATPRVMVYSKRFHDEVGLGREATPATWNEMLEMSRRLLVTDAERVIRRGIHLPNGTLDLAQEFQLWMYVSGGQILSEDLRAPVFNNDLGRQALAFVRQQFELNNPPGFAVTGLSSSPTTGWLRGEVAMFRAAPSVGTQAKLNYPHLLEEMGTYFLPPPTANLPPGSGTSINGVAIMATSKHPDEAWEVLKVLLSAEVNEQFIRLAGHVSTRRDMIPVVMEAAPELLPWYEVMEAAIPFPAWPEGGGYNYSSALGEPVRDGVRGSVPVETALEEAERRVRILLNSFWAEVDAGGAQ